MGDLKAEAAPKPGYKLSLLQGGGLLYNVFFKTFNSVNHEIIADIQLSLSKK